MGITGRICCVLAASLITLTGGCGGDSQLERVERIQLQLQASSDINPNDYSTGNPVRILIYQLRSTDAFLFSDYLALVNNPERAVTEQMNLFYDGMLSPGESRTVTIPVSQDIPALGIVTAFQEIQNSRWKEIYPVPNNALRRSTLFSGGRDKKEKRVSVSIRHLTTTLESLE